MPLDLTGTSYSDGGNFGHAQQNAANIMSTKSRAVLYVFKPYDNQFGDVGLRPMQYMFDENFLGETQEITDLSKRGTSNAGMMINDLMLRTNLNDKMMPSIIPSISMRTSVLSDRHRFILVLTESAANLIGGNTLVHSAPSSQVRRIYTGYFEDEPFNQTSFGASRPTLNPSSFMVITHKTVVGAVSEHGRFGTKLRLNTQVSEEFVHPQISGALMSQGQGGRTELHLMTPENCLNSIDTNDDGFSLSMPGVHSDITRDKGVNVVVDLLEQPAQNVAQVVKGMIRFQDDITHRSRLSHHRQDNFFEDAFMGEGTARLKLAGYMSLPRAHRSSIFDLDVDARISPVDLDTMVSGELDVVPFDLERPIFYETADQMETSVTNQYSFLISSVISPILNSAGVNAMAFEYSVARIAGQVQQDFRTYQLEPNWECSTQDMLSMAKAIEVELVNGIFSTIFHSKGDFHVSVNANVVGMTTVRLSLVGQGYRNPVDWEFPSCLGGLVTPLLGDAATNATNTEAIETLYNQATGTNKAHNGFGDDDRAFADLTNALPFQQGGFDTGPYVGTGFDRSEMELD